MSYTLCGCYYFVHDHRQSRRDQVYLPQVANESHTTILSTTSRTKLKQTFTNSTKNAIDECIYSFPLYDGVAVVGFTCHVGSRTLHGVVKERNKAKAVYEAAKAKGEVAGLLEQLPEASDVFTTKLGNVPSGETVLVEIEYVRELKQDAETSGIRFTIPTKIAPRYGSVASNELNQSATTSGIKIVIDAQMPTGSNIQGLQSPSHPISVALGTLSTDPDADASLSKASASLSLDATNLDRDFVLIVLAKDTANPRAILESHPTIPDQRALMVTLVPKFSLPPSRPEIVFVVDRSGSMAQNILMLISAMKVFLKSLPVGVKFNICSFGSTSSFLWPKSKSYGQDTLSQALSHVGKFQADMGGTETFRALKTTIDNRYKDIPLEVMLLTDGDIWQQNELFAYINEQVEESKGNIRVFPLGLGSGVSHALIEGIARAGNGFGQSVQDGEKLDNRVVRMLKGALSPHITDYSLEVKYEVEEDFELIEKFDKVTDGFKVTVQEIDAPEEAKRKKPISLFDPKADVDEVHQPISSDKTGQDRYAHLPIIPLPKLLQAPHKIPPLYAFSRTTVYLLMSPETYHKTPTSVVLHATSAYGPLELEISVDVIAQPGQTIHQLAAKKAVQDLEEGRGWLYEAVDEKSVPLKKRYPSKFDDMVEREAVRLGVKYKIAGKWCSFVAVKDENEETEDNPPEYWEGTDAGKRSRFRKEKKRMKIAKHDVSTGEALEEFASVNSFAQQPIYPRRMNVTAHKSLALSSPPPAPPSASLSMFGSSRFASQAQQAQNIRAGFASYSPASTQESGRGNSMFGRVGSAAPRAQMQSFGGAQRYCDSGSGGMSAAPSQAPPGAGNNSFGSTTAASQVLGNSLFGNTAVPSAPSPAFGMAQPASYSYQYSTVVGGDAGLHQHGSSLPDADSDEDSEAGRDALPAGKVLKSKKKGGLFGGVKMNSFFGSASTNSYAYGGPKQEVEKKTKESKAFNWAQASDEAKVLRLIELQDFEGYWKFVEEMNAMLGPGKVSEVKAKKADTSWVTMLVVVFLERKMKAFEETWDLVVEKARSWLSEKVGEDRVKQIEAEVKSVLA